MARSRQDGGQILRPGRACRCHTLALHRGNADTSALVKLLIAQPESSAIAELLPPASVVTSELTAVELACTARRRGLLNGTYVSVEAFHLFRYLDERVFTFSLRELDDFGRFSAVLKAAAGRRLTYAELTGRSSVA